MVTEYLVPSVYATIAAARAAIPADLSGQGIQDIIIDAGTYSEQNTFSGFSNESPTDFIRIRCAEGDEHKGIFGAGVKISAGSTSGVLNLRSDYMQVLDVELESTVINGRGVSTFDCTNLRIERCLANQTVSGAAGFEMQNTGQNYIINCISKNFTNGFTGQLGGNHNFIGCIGYSNATAGFNRVGNGMVCRNCVGANNGSFDFSASIGGSNNVSEDATAPGPNSQINITIGDLNWVSTPNNFNITQGSILQNAGLLSPRDYLKDLNLDNIVTNEWPAGPYFLQLPSGEVKSDSFSLLTGELKTALFNETQGKIISRPSQILTVNANTQGLDGVLIENGRIYHIKATVVAIQDDGSNYAAYEKIATVYRVDNNLPTLLGSVTTVKQEESNAAWDMNLVVNNNSLVIEINGVAATNIKWGSQIEYTYIEI